MFSLIEVGRSGKTQHAFYQEKDIAYKFQCWMKDYSEDSGLSEASFVSVVENDQRKTTYSLELVSPD